MRAKEFIFEQPKLKKYQSDAIPNGNSFPGTNNDYYAQYRLGIAMATAPGPTIDKDGIFGQNFATVAYTDADQEIIDAAAKNMGLKKKSFAKGPSKEHNNTQVVSPVPKPKKNKYGV